VKNLADAQEKLKTRLRLAAFPSRQSIFFDNKKISKCAGCFKAPISSDLPQPAAERLTDQIHELKSIELNHNSHRQKTKIAAILKSYKL
jgi:hypothetical protein